MTDSILPYTKDLVRGDLCAVTMGHFQFLAETESSVRSVQHFMPGVRIRVAVDPVHFSLFNRYGEGEGRLMSMPCSCALTHLCRVALALLRYKQ